MDCSPSASSFLPRRRALALFLGTSLPISVLPSFALLDLCGVSLNPMLGGLALGVGMLVDNSVIALENIHRLQAEGHSPRARPRPRARAR
ncbi:MAG: efflux RND transporter permease subunit [Candidatus Eisenbacteria bacterium]